MNSLIIVVEIILVLYDVYLFICCKEKAFMFYCICATVCPMFEIMGMKIPFEIFGFIGLFIGVALRLFVHPRFILDKDARPQVIWMLLIGIASVVSVLVHDCQWNVIPLFAYFRYTFILVFFIMYDIRKYFLPYIKIVLVVEMAVVAAQVFVPSSIDLFLEMYINRTDIIDRFVLIGRITRIFGTFETPVALGFFSSISLATLVFDFLYMNRSRRNLVWAVAALAEGMASTSKAFYVSAVVILCFFLLNNIRIRRKMRRKSSGFEHRNKKSRFLPLVGVAALGSVCTYFALKNTEVSIEGYLQSAFGSMGANLAIRFGSSGRGGTTETMLQANQGYEKIIGLGTTTPYGEVIQDSQWGALYHGTGFLGVSILIFWLVRLIIMTEKKAQYGCELLLILVALNALVIVSFESLMGMMIIIYVIQCCRQKATDYDRCG